MILVARAQASKGRSLHQPFQCRAGCDCIPVEPRVMCGHHIMEKYVEKVQGTFLPMFINIKNVTSWDSFEMPLKI